MRPTLIFRDCEYKYGFHIQKHPSLKKTIEVRKDLPLTAMQIYLSNSRSRNPPQCKVSDMLDARKIIEQQGYYICIHGNLLYNLAGTTEGEKDSKFNYALENTRTGLIAELDIGVGLGAGVVVHIGSSKNKKRGIEIISETITNVLTRTTDYTIQIASKMNLSVKDLIKRRKIILENAAGEGNKIGSNLNEISQIIKGVDKNLQSQIKVCIDTAHSFGAGLYDWGKPSEIKRFYKDFDNIIGLNHLEVFHLNDSRCSSKKANNAPFGSHKDRHENLGLGYIFSDKIGGVTSEGSRMEGLKTFFLEARKRHINIIGEPPAKTEEGRQGPGGIRDWDLVTKLLKDTEYPLEEEF